MGDTSPTNRKSRRWWERVLAQFVPWLVVAVYLTIGVFVYRRLDERFLEIAFIDVVLFEFVTFSTIGYGDVAPKSTAGKVFTIVYALFGIPLLLVALASTRKLANRVYWNLQHFIGSKVAQTRLASDAEMPKKVIVFLHLLTVFVGLLTISHTGDPFTVDFFYFSFISFTTIGFGDKLPIAKGALGTIFVLLYLAWGIVITSAIYGILDTQFAKVFNISGRLSAADLHVWIGGECISVKELAEVISKKFNTTPRQVRLMLRDLDRILQEAVVEKSDSKDDELRAPLARLDEFDEEEQV